MDWRLSARRGNVPCYTTAEMLLLLLLLLATAGGGRSWLLCACLRPQAQAQHACLLARSMHAGPSWCA